MILIKQTLVVVTPQSNQNNDKGLCFIILTFTNINVANLKSMISYFLLYHHAQSLILTVIGSKHTTNLLIMIFFGLKSEFLLPYFTVHGVQDPKETEGPDCPGIAF